MEVASKEHDCGMILRIGEYVSYNGRTYRLQSIQPMSLPNRRAQLIDLQTGEHLWVPVDRLNARTVADLPSGEPPGLGKA
jgi:hypothetical protein